MKLTASSEERLAQQRQISASIFVVEKTRQTIVAALNNVLRNAWEIESWLACHIDISPLTGVDEKRRQARSAVGSAL